MIKVVYCVTKKAGLTDEEFFRYWEDIHGQSALEFPDSASWSKVDG
jgi:hypothetical protein